MSGEFKVDVEDGQELGVIFESGPNHRALQVKNFTPLKGSKGPVEAAGIRFGMVLVSINDVDFAKLKASPTCRTPLSPGKRTLTQRRPRTLHTTQAPKTNTTPPRTPHSLSSRRRSNS